MGEKKPFKRSVYCAIKDRSKPPAATLGGKGNMLAVLELTGIFLIYQGGDGKM